MDSGLDFWFSCIGRKLGGESPEQSTAIFVPQRVKAGVKTLRLGTLDTYYIASPHSSFLIGRIDLPEVDGLSFVAVENTLALPFLANWLIHSAVPPFMIGVVGKASPLRSFSVSHSDRMVSFCEAGKGFGFDLEKVRTAYKAFDGLPWKTGVAGAIHEYQQYQSEPNEGHKLKLMKSLAKHPGLRKALITADIRPDSGEYAVLSWMYRGSKEKSDDFLSANS